jgi:hypothetical protein
MSALVLTACGDDDDGGGGGDTVSAGDYASDICTAFTDWRDTIQEQRDDLTGSLQPGISPEDGKSKLESFLGDVVGATDELVTNVEAAGVPDAENGQEVADALQSIADDAQSELQDAEQKVSELPTDSREAFGTAASGFATEIQTALQNVGQGLGDIESKEVEKAFEEEEACQA